VLALGLSKSARTLGKLREVLASKDPEIAFAAKTSLARRDDAAAVAELVAEYARTVAQQVDYADEIGCKHYDRLCETIAFQIGSVEALVAMFDHGLRSPSAGSEGLGLGVRILPPWTGAVQNLRLVFQDVGIAVPDFQTQKDAASWWEVNRQKAESALHRDQERLKTLAGRNRLRQILKTRALPPPDSNLGFTVQ
jgi:hypothetical protein